MNSVVNERIKELRTEKNLTQKTFAEMLFCNRQKIADWERGKSCPSTEDLINISKIFNISTDYLLGLTETRTTDMEIKDICELTGLSERAVRILNCKSSYYDESIKIINFLIEESDACGDIENGVFTKRNLIDSMYNYFFYDYGSCNNSDNDLFVTSLGHIFTSFEQYEEKRKDVLKDWENTDLLEMKVSRISKNEILDNVYINRIIEQLKITKERFKGADNAND